VCLRIPLSRATVKELPRRLQDAERRDALRLVRHPPVLMALLGPHVPVAVVCERWGLSPAWRSAWQQAVLLRGLDRWVDGHGGGRRPQVPPSQTPRCVALLDAGLRVVGGETACGPAVLSRVLLGRQGGGRDHRPAVGTLLPHLGVSCHPARVVSAHRAAARRHAWLQQAWPQLLRAATRRQGLILWEDTARCAPWGSWRDPWARRGPPPAVTPRGQRKGAKVCGALDACFGRLLSPGLEGRCPSDRDQAFLPLRMAQSTPPLCRMHAGAR
jgi:hypothetical protein